MTSIHFKLIKWLLDKYGLTWEQWQELYFYLKTKPKLKRNGGDNIE